MEPFHPHSFQWLFPSCTLWERPGDCSPQTYQTAEQVQFDAGLALNGTGEETEADARGVASTLRKKKSPISLSYAFLLIQAGKRWKSNILCPKHAQCPTHGCCSCISVRGNCKRFAQHQLQLQRQTWGSMCLLCVLLSFIYSTHQWNSVNVLGLRKLLLTVYKPTDLRAVVVFHCCVLWSKCLCKGVMALLFHLNGNCTSSFLIFCLEYFTSENTNAASNF